MSVMRESCLTLETGRESTAYGARLARSLSSGRPAAGPVGWAGTTTTERATEMSNSHGPLRIGIGGPVGSGKTALMDLLCKAMRQRYDIAAITNDIYTKWDG